jgi:hypothetical protein
MYEVYKKYHFQFYGEEYGCNFEQRSIDIRNFKLLQKKITDMLSMGNKKEVVIFDDVSLAAAFEFVINKMPDWWKVNMFNPNGIYKNWEKIIQQIKNGRQSGKAALDDFIAGL